MSPKCRHKIRRKADFGLDLGKVRQSDVIVRIPIFAHYQGIVAASGKTHYLKWEFHDRRTLIG